jgi:hypothetical protein
MRIERMDAIAELVETVSFDELVHHLGELPHKLDRFIDAGVIVPDQDGRFVLERSVADYLSYWTGVIRREAKRA